MLLIHDLVVLEVIREQIGRNIHPSRQSFLVHILVQLGSMRVFCSPQRDKIC